MTTATTENKTDATQGETLAIRARTRQAELRALLTTLATHETSVRADVERALSAVGQLLTGDSEHPSEATAAELSRWLEGAKQLGEKNTKPPAARS